MAISYRSLDKISGIFFTAGFFISKLKFIPFKLLLPIVNIISLSSYLVGYITWYIAALLYPDLARKRDQWFGFFDLKEQYQLAAFIGTVATLFCLITPSLVCLPLWLYVISNLIWAVGEYHKYQNPPVDDENYSKDRQTAYLKYVFLALTLSIVSALAATLAVCFPPIAAVTLMVGTGIGIVLGVASMYYWKVSTFDTFEKNAAKKSSYEVMSSQLESVDSSCQRDIGAHLSQDNTQPIYSSIWRKQPLTKDEIKSSSCMPSPM